MINARLRTDTPSDAPLSDGVSFVGEFFYGLHPFEDGIKAFFLNAHSFEDGIRAAQRKEPHKNSKTFCGGPRTCTGANAPLASRGALSECRTEGPAIVTREARQSRRTRRILSRHGRGCASAEFLRPRAMFSQYCSPLDYAGARIKLFSKGEKLVPHDRRTVQYRGPRRKYFRWGKRSSRATDERRHSAPPRQASASCDAVGEESPNGAPRKMYILWGPRKEGVQYFHVRGRKAF